jgi:hypothetical protein
MNGSVDILRYTGEGGNRWPTTSGPAEIQLSARQGVPYVPIAGTGPATTPPPTPSRTFGRFRFTIKGATVPGRRGSKRKLTLTFKNASGKRVARTRFKRATRRRAKAKVSGVAATGSYRWVLRAGKRKLAAGRVKVRPVEGLQASPGTTLVARVR